MKLNIGIIGFGYWGPNLVRNFSSSNQTLVTRVVDFRKERLDLVNQLYPGVITSSDTSTIFSDANLDAVVIATPVNTHFELAKQALLAGKHVLIEKPVTSSYAEAVELLELSQRLKKVVMVDHTFLYTGAIQYLQEFIANNHLGNVKYFDSTRINLGLFQHDVNVLWDLAPHDLSILSYIQHEQPVSVNATGISQLKNGIENLAYLTLNYQSGFIAHLNCSWTSPVKIRTLLIGGDKKMVLYNDLEPTEKVKVYDTGLEVKSDEERNRLLVDYRVGDVFIPKLSGKEALAGVVADFANAIKQNTKPVSNLELGSKVVQILAAAQKSIKNGGNEVKL